MMPSQRIAKRQRKGAAAVEFAMTAPLLFMLLFGALELGHANMVFNATEAAAYEGARRGIVPGATAAECEAAVERILQISGIQGASVTVAPANLAVDTTSVTVQISVPYASNTVVTPVFTNALTINRQCELRRERL